MGEKNTKDKIDLNYHGLGQNEDSCPDNEILKSELSSINNQSIENSVLSEIQDNEVPEHRKETIILKFQEAQEIYNEAKGKNPSEAIEIKKKALKVYREAYDLDHTTKNYILTFSIANCSTEVNKQADALEFYLKTLEIKPDHNLCNIYVGRMYYDTAINAPEDDKKGYFEKSVKYLEIGLKINLKHDNFFTYNDIVRGLFELGKENEAREKYEEIKKKNPKVADKVFNKIQSGNKFKLA